MRDKALIACLWETGARIHEPLALDLGDVKVQESTANHGRKIYVAWFEKTKVYGEEHEGYVNETAPVLSAWLETRKGRARDEPLFPAWGGKRMSRDGALHVVKKAARRAGIEKRVWSHQFRHSRATYLLANGMTEAQVKALLGRSPGSTMLSRYSHIASRDAYRSLLALSGLEPEPVTIERLHFDDDRLRPAVPVLAPPGAATPRLGAVDPALLEALVQVELPKAVNREVQALLNEHAENERALIAEVHRLRSELEELRGRAR